MNKLRISPAAASDLAEIKTYISLELHNPQAAQRIVKSITHDLRHLQQTRILAFLFPPKPAGRSICGHCSAGIIFFFTVLRTRRYRSPVFWMGGRIICVFCLVQRKKNSRLPYHCLLQARETTPTFISEISIYRIANY